ncbi:HrpE/YscL family type III secretion apparatus protein [Brevifollis gellanilyticus]|uniref:Type 3 secretion system stator protein n=1 Tax=Brevifollis gellanilyticus TaxID=748831 RepID=A0A512MAG8_9BACT|nr:HrpE/YscL family type III secretion apparatus protein [Brevifollis gellanilyticus]GEP43730.1 type III secretion system protein [Brevifollis gellanilyticus]
MLCLEKSGVAVAPDSKILKRDEHAFIIDGQRILDAARHEATLIRQQAIADAETKRQEGFQQGQEEGKAQIAEHIVECMGQSAAYFSKVEDVMVDLVMRAVRSVIGEMNQHDLIEKIVRRALESTRNENHVTVRVSPGQADWLKSRLSAIMQTFPKIQFLDVQADSRLPENGCVLETEIGVVDATLETQLKAIEKALIRSMK